MKVTTEKIENQQVVLEITVPAEELEKAYAQAFKNISKQVNIPGFRKGKAPKKMVEKHVGVEYIMDEAFKTVYNASFGEAVDESKQVPVSRVDLEEVQLELGKDVIYKTTFTAKPEVKLGQYKEVKVAKADTTVSDADVDAQLARMLDRQADMVEAEEGSEVAKDDFITLDFKGFVDGEAFAGGEGKDYPLQIGSNSFIPGFEDQLIGAKIGEDKDVNVTFPEEYHAEELKGKPAVFKCTVKSIKRKVLPALDDEFAKKASTFQTLDELKADIRSNLEKTAESKAESEKREEAIKQATENATVEVPEVMVEHRINIMIQELAMRLEQQGMKLEMYLQYAGTDINKLRETYRDTAAANVKTDLVLEAVAKAEGIKVGTEELDAEVEAMAKAYGETAAEVKKIITQQGRTPDLIETVLKRKTAQFIIDNIAE